MITTNAMVVLAFCFVIATSTPRPTKRRKLNNTTGTVYTCILVIKVSGLHASKSFRYRQNNNT